MSHTDMGIVGATTDTFILFENGVRRNRLVLPGLSNAASHAVQARHARSPSRRASWESHLARPIRQHRITSRIGAPTGLRQQLSPRHLQLRRQSTITLCTYFI
jgi:hypothetical protein